MQHGKHNKTCNCTIEFIKWDLKSPTPPNASILFRIAVATQHKRRAGEIRKEGIKV